MKKTYMFWVALSAFAAGEFPASGSAMESGRLEQKLQNVGNSGMAGREKSPAGSRSVLRSASDGEALQLYGNMIYSSAWDTSESGKYGIYSFPAASSLSFTPVDVDKKYNLTGATYADGLYCGYSVLEYSGSLLRIMYYLFDADNGWATLQSKSLPVTDKSYRATSAIAYDYKTGKIFAQFFTADGAGLRLCTVDKMTGEPTQVALLDNLFYTFSFDADGTLYGIADGGNLCKIDTSTGKSTVVGNTGLSPQYGQSATIDFKSGRMYWAALESNMNSGLYSVDVSTGKAELVSQFDGTYEFVGLHTAPFVADAAPAQVNDLKVVYDGNGSLDGKITFTAPAKSFGGSSLSGAMEVNLVIDNEAVALDDSDVNPGESYSYQYSFSEGLHKVQVSLSNSAGKGAKSIINSYAGIDVPGKVGDLKFTLTGGKADVSWTAPTEGAQGGYFDKSLLKYKVVRNPGKVDVTTTTDTKFSETLPDVMASYYYVVTPVAEKDGVAAETERILYGKPATAPYKETFDDADALDIYTVIDANNDGSTWKYGNGNVTSEIGDAQNADEWLITPPITLTNDYIYKLRFKTKGYGTFYSESLETAFGKKNSVDGMTEKLGSYTVSGNEYLENQSVIEIPASGEYYFGFHHCSTGNFYQIFVDDIEVEKYIPTTAPDAVSGYTVEADKDGVLKATVKFTTPAKAINGSALESISKVEIYNGEKLVHTENGVEMGKEYSFSLDATQGWNTFNVIVYDSKGRGKDAYQKVFCGIDVPQAVQNLTATWSDDDLTANIAWEAPSEEGMNGGKIDTSALTYNYASYVWGSWIDMQTGLKTPNYQMKSNATDGVQTYVTGAICAVSAGGKSPYTQFGIMLGKALPMPFAESFASGSVSTQTWTVATVGGDDKWSMYKDSESLKSADGDGGYAMLVNSKASPDDSRLESPIIDIASLANPTLELFAKGDGEFSIEMTDNGMEFKTVESVALTSEWKKYSIPLTAYKGKNRVQIGFRASLVNANSLVAIDGLELKSADGGVDEIGESAAVYGLQGAIAFDGLQGTSVEVFSVDGRKVNAFVCQSSKEELPMDAAGLYIVKAGARTYKVLVR